MVRLAIDEMVAEGAHEVVLEAEVTNKGALALYAGLGFIRDKRLLRCVATPGILLACCLLPGGKYSVHENLQGYVCFWARLSCFLCMTRGRWR